MRQIKIGFTDFWKGFVPEDSYFVSILRKHFDVELYDTDNPIAKREVEYLFCGGFSQNYLDFDCVRIFFTAENLIPDFNLYDYAIGFEKMEIGDRYFWDPWCYGCIRQNSKLLSDIYANRQADHMENIEKKKFCAMVITNGWNADQFRLNFFSELSKYKQIDSGGKYLNNIGGKVSDKIAFLKNYKFSFAMENVSHEGYCTEKITESFAAGTVPIYWGDESVTEYFNRKAFINCHDYSSVNEVIERIREIDNDDNKYITMLKEPVFADRLYTPACQDIRFEKWLVSIFEGEYRFRRNCIGAMQRYGNTCRIRRDILKKIGVNEQEELRFQVKWTIKNCPFQEKDRIVLYGAGKWGIIFYQWINENHWGEVVCWIDKFMFGKRQMRYPVSSLDSLSKVSFDYIFITIENKNLQEEVMNELIRLGVVKEKILVNIVSIAEKNI